jgi:hypothetical protein
MVWQELNLLLVNISPEADTAQIYNTGHLYIFPVTSDSNKGRDQSSTLFPTTWAKGQFRESIYSIKWQSFNPYIVVLY